MIRSAVFHPLDLLHRGWSLVTFAMKVSKAHGTLFGVYYNNRHHVYYSCPVFAITSQAHTHLNPGYPDNRSELRPCLHCPQETKISLCKLTINVGALAKRKPSQNKVSM